MKSDVICKRSRHDARRIGGAAHSSETPSASPGVSRRASPDISSDHEHDVEMPAVAAPVLAPDSSTRKWANSSNTNTNNTNGGELMGALGELHFPGPYRPDYLPQMFPLPADFDSDKVNIHHEDENCFSKCRRMSEASNTSASEPPLSSVGSFSSSYTNNSSVASEFPFSSYPSAGYNLTYFSHYNNAGGLRSSSGFLHPPMMLQTAVGSPGNWHPPMLPPAEEVHPPMVIQH